MMYEDVTRRSFLKTTTAAIASAVVTPAGAACQKSSATRKPNDTELAERIDALIKKLVAGDEFSGFALIARDGKPLLRKAYGLANKEFNAPNQPDTKFNVASMGKMFTGVAVAQLDMYPESGYAVAVLSNYDHPAIAPIVETSRELITRRD